MYPLKFNLPGFFGLLIFCHATSALELSLGSGDFNMGADINPLFSSDVEISAHVWSLTEKHKNIRDSKLYYQFQFDYFSSDTVDNITEFASHPASTSIPVIGSSIDDGIDQFTQIPVPADYQIRGIDFNIGLGYDLIETPETTLGIAFNTGLSTPFMKIRNMDTTANLVIDLLDTFDTKVETYKLGSSLYAEHKLNNQLSLMSHVSLNFQTGTMENDTLGNNISIDGTYQTLNIGLKYQPGFLNGLSLTGGYNYRIWDYGSTSVETPVGKTKVARELDMDFVLSNIYLGVAYHF